MSKSVAWVTVLLVGAVVAASAFGPASGGHLASAAAVSWRLNSAVEQDPPTPTRTPAGAAAPSTRTVQLSPYNDAAVVSGGVWSSDQNLGGWTRLAVGPRQGGTYRAYLRFLVAGLPLGLQINAARIILQPLDGGARPVAIEADVVQDDWSEDTITWNAQPLSTYRAGVATWQPGNMAPFSIDVTSAVQQWYACGGTSNSGLELSADLASSSVDFASRKSDASPMLEVTYQTAVAPVNCAAPPTANVNLTAPQAAGPSTTGAQLGAMDPNMLNNIAVLNGTPYGSQSIPVAPGPSRPGNPFPSPPGQGGPQTILPVVPIATAGPSGGDRGGP